MTEEKTTEEKTDKREVKKHPLPDTYKSPFENVISQWLTYGGKLAKGEVLHKFEMQVSNPIGGIDKNIVGMYGLSIVDFITRGAQKLGTEVDATFKKTLFIGIESPELAGNATKKNHLNAQKQLDAWVYSPRVGKGKTTAVSSVVASLVSAGVLSDSAIVEITTNEELQTAIAKAAKK